MTKFLKNYLDKIKIGAEQSYKNLTMYPLLFDYLVPIKYLTLNEALSKDTIEIIAMDENRTAPKLMVVQKSNENERARTLWDYIEQFARTDGQIGAIFLINGKISGTVCFSRPEAFKVSFIKIVECYAKKAADVFDPTMDLKSSKSKVINFLKTMNESPIETPQSTAGIGTECRMSFKKCSDNAFAI